MTVLSFYSGYLPGEKYGGPVSSLYNFAELLGGDTDVYIVCSNHDLDEKTPYPDISAGWNQVGKAKVKYISDDEMVFFVYNRIIGEVKPDIIYMGHKHTNAMLTSYDTKVIQAGCLSGGADEYCMDKRLRNKAEQIISVITEDGLDCLYDVKF